LRESAGAGTQNGGLLDAIVGADKTLEVDVDDRRVRLTSLDRVLWPATGATKRDMFRYYVEVAPRLLPWIAARPLTLLRFPYGLGGHNWYQTMCPHPPPWMRTHPLTRDDGTVSRNYCVIDDLAGLLWAANLSAIELHRLQSTTKDIDHPTDVVFDLDPGDGTGLGDCALIALRLRSVLRTDSGPAAVLSGGSGIHVYVPTDERMTYRETKAFARDVASSLAADDGRVTDRPLKTERIGKVFIDWSQNDMNKSLIAPWSLRALPWPALARPVAWDEVERLAAGEPPHPAGATPPGASTTTGRDEGAGSALSS